MLKNNFILKIRKFVLIYTKAKTKNIFSFIFVLEKPKFHMQRTDLKIELTSVIVIFFKFIIMKRN